MGRFVAVFENGTKAVFFAPMISVVFIAARIRALQLTKATDSTIPPSAGPQPWAQSAMFVASWGVVIQYLTAVIVPWIVGVTGAEDKKMDSIMGYSAPSKTNKIIAAVLDVMTPDTLPPYSREQSPVPIPQPPPPTVAMRG